MSDLRTILERGVGGATPPPDGFERMLHRRDRKRRNQRIAAGVVGIAVFVAAVWIVRDVALLDRSETSVIPRGSSTTGPAETGPAETGPTVIGPRVTGPVIGPTGDPFSVGFDGLPPENATPSEPPHGELAVSDGGIHPWYSVHVYADGRLIWARGLQTNPGPTVSVWIEQRLTPEGVDLLRSGAVELGGQAENPGEQLPVSAWENPELRPYVPSNYTLCPWGGTKWMKDNPPAARLRVLPAAARDLLRGAEPPSDPEGNWCFKVTIEDARALAEILSDAGFEGGSGAGHLGRVGFADGQNHFFDLSPILPDGECCHYEGG
ncbi:MAG TPA: hypothetical protein VJZ98_03460 [Actinomycetota bacterium]|nr:hypothetical protein [Actinomycetota bacterium]